MFILFLGLSSFSTGCDRAPSPELPPPDMIHFEVDGEGVYYASLRPDGTLSPASALHEIPLTGRSAVAIHIESQTKALIDSYYIANLLHASAGQQAAAHLLSLEDAVRIPETANHAEKAALSIRDFALLFVDSPQQESEAPPVARSRSQRTAKKKPVRKSNVPDLRADSDDRIPIFGLEDEGKPKNSKIITLFDSDAASTNKNIEIHRINTTTPTSINESTGAPKSSRSKSNNSWRPVTFYYASYCGHCRRAKAWLDENGVPYTFVDIKASKQNAQKMAQFIKQKGGRDAVPTFAIGDEIMQGWNPERFERLARR